MPTIPFPCHTAIALRRIGVPRGVVCRVTGVPHTTLILLDSGKHKRLAPIIADMRDDDGSRFLTPAVLSACGGTIDSNGRWHAPVA